MRGRTRRTAEELEALLEGRLSADEAGTEARRLATLASTVVEERPGPVATLSEDRRLLLRDQLLDDIAAMDAPAAVPAPARRRPARAALASGLASTMIAATGVTVAAQEAMPGDALYGLKKGTESVRMNLASDATQAARLELRFAEERLEEIAAGASRIPATTLTEALAEMDRRSMAGAQQLVRSAEESGDEELLAELDGFLERQSSGLSGVFVRLPIEVRPYAEDSLAVLREIRTTLLRPALEACDCVDIVPASHFESEHVRRTDAESLPPAPAASESEAPTEDSSGGEEGRDLRQPLDDLTSGETTTGGDTGDSRLREPLEETGEKVGDAVDDTVDRTRDAVDDTVDRTRDAVDDTTDGAGELLDDTADTLDDTTDDLTDGVEDTTGSVGDLLGSATTTLGDLLGR